MRGAVLLAMVALVACDQAFGLERDNQLAPGDWAAVAAGHRHTCAVRLDGTLWCWGSNIDHQLGVVGIEHASPVQVGTSTAWRTVSARGSHTCGLQTDGSLWCWGDNQWGQLGLGDLDPRVQPTRVPAGPWKRLDVTAGTTCAIREDGTLWCWGLNTSGQVGDGSLLPQLLPIQIDKTSTTPWVQISGHAAHTCGIKADDTLWCWGVNPNGELADPNILDSPTPHLAQGSYTAVAASLTSTCALRTDGTIKCWGSNASGQLGNGTTSDSRRGVSVGGNEDNWVDIVGGGSHVCGVRSDGSLHCWGDNSFGQVPSTGIGVVASVPTKIVAISPNDTPWSGTWTAVALGSFHTCAIDDGHRLWCAGSDGGGQVGRGSPSHLVPARVPGVWRTISAGENFTCGLDDADDVRCWGRNIKNEIGDGTGLTAQVPTKILANGPFTDVIAGFWHACARGVNGPICWGANDYGQLGNGTMGALFTPESVPTPWPTATSYHTCSIDNGQLYCWGLNGTGELGVADLVSRLSPSPVSDMGWTTVATGSNHTCAAGTGGLYCWGYNVLYQLGDGTMTDAAVPVLISAAGADSIATGDYSSCSILAGTASCWGWNVYGQLGIGTELGVVPTQLTGLWSQIAIAYDHACGIGTDGSLSCWGGNSFGRLGLGTVENRNTPLRVGADHDWRRVVVGHNHSCALKTDDSLWCWGSNELGEAGDGTSWSRQLQLIP